MGTPEAPLQYRCVLFHQKGASFLAPMCHPGFHLKEPDLEGFLGFPTDFFLVQLLGLKVCELWKNIAVGFISDNEPNLFLP